MAEVQRDQRRVLVPQVVTHPLEVTLEIQVLLEAAGRSRRHLACVATNVTPVLLADVHAQPALAELRFQHRQRASGRRELLPISARPRARHIAPNVEQVKVAAFDLIGQVAEIGGKDR